MLDTLHKLSDIVLKGALVAAVAIITLYLTWQEHTGEHIKQCDAFFTGLIDSAVKQQATDQAKDSLLYRIGNYGRMCGNLTDQQIQNIMNVMVPQRVEGAVAETGGQPLGWVALSRIPATKYADTNFDPKSGKSTFDVEDIIKARWSANIRLKNTPVDDGDNPVVGVIQAGTCVKILARDKGIKNEWAKISLADCT
ncbi:hypothetical protein [Rhizobium sp. Leaf262]|uniref:hypothetical protein n=1 Tax=Rhizobium sp. Leaf262 TaxID=1736312 RepID=UPI000A42DA4B|nr:hypothetical protein [Rhizobium sp. Leaf262]